MTEPSFIVSEQRLAEAIFLNKGYFHSIQREAGDIVTRQCDRCLERTFINAEDAARAELVRAHVRMTRSSIMEMIRRRMGIPASAPVELWVRQDGVWRRGDGGTIHHHAWFEMSGHEIMEAHVRAGSDPDFRCGALARNAPGQA